MNKANMDLRAILNRVERRLEILGITANAASNAAGKKDAIRNLQRAVRDDRRTGITTATLVALAPVLHTTPAWLIDGTGTEEASAAIPRDDLIEGLLTAFRLLGHNESWLGSYVRVVVAMLEAPQAHSEQTVADRVEIAARQFVKSKPDG